MFGHRPHFKCMYLKNISLNGLEKFCFLLLATQYSLSLPWLCTARTLTWTRPHHHFSHVTISSLVIHWRMGSDFPLNTDESLLWLCQVDLCGSSQGTSPRSRCLGHKIFNFSIYPPAVGLFLNDQSSCYMSQQMNIRRNIAFIFTYFWRKFFNLCMHVLFLWDPLT